jgi:F0F1-type ATP synthase assembly protein I
MFVPTVGGMSAGYFADQMYGTKPWLFVAGLVLGTVVAGLLVTSQLKKS